LPLSLPGLQGDTFGPAEAEATIRTNVRGTAALTDALLPLLRARAAASPAGARARVVNVCSLAGTLRIFRDPALAQRFRNATTPEAVFALMDEFLAHVAAGTHAAHGWPNRCAARVATLCMHAAARVRASLTLLTWHVLTHRRCSRALQHVWREQGWRGGADARAGGIGGRRAAAGVGGVSRLVRHGHV
jgi:NAD(P)-dependent dehydrogenase (short-subunit alcohol dehydrogenase family)